jgi:hypothetical protein
MTPSWHPFGIRRWLLRHPSSSCRGEILRQQICFFFVWLAQRWFDTSTSNQAFDQHFDLDPLMARPFLSPAEPLVASMPPFAVLPALAIYAIQLAAVGTVAVVVAPLPFATG